MMPGSRIIIYSALGIATATTVIFVAQQGDSDEPAESSAAVTPLKPLNSDSIPSRVVMIRDGEVDTTLLESRQETQTELTKLQKTFDAAGEMTPEQERKLRRVLKQARHAAISANKRRQMKWTLQVIRRMLEEPDYPGLRRRRDDSSQANFSWRVHLLPLLGYKQLYNRFQLDEAWDSEHNRPLLDEMPSVYRHWADDEHATATRFLAVDGEGTLCSGGQLHRIGEIEDPESDTIALVVVGPELAVPWTSPQDFELDETTFSDLMTKMPSPQFLIGTVEGAAISFHVRGSFARFQAMATTAGGEPNALDAMFKEKHKL